MPQYPLPLAYGQIVHAGVERSPFLVPLRLHSQETLISLTDGGPEPDLGITFELTSLDQNNLDNVELAFRLSPEPSNKAITDLEFRLLIWMSDDLIESNVTGGTAAAEDQQYVLLGYRTPPGEILPRSVNFLLGTITTNLPSGITTSRFSISLSIPNRPEIGQLGSNAEVFGGMVEGPQLVTPGVVTSPQPYAEQPQPFKTIDLSRAFDPPPPGATSPVSGVFADFAVNNPSDDPTQLRIRAWLPSTAPAPADPPSVALDPAAGTLRAGTYTYVLTLQHENGSETPASPRSDAIVVPGGGAVAVGAFPPIPDAPPENGGLRVSHVVIYRTESSDDGESGDDIRVGEVPVDPADPSAFSAASFTDAGFPAGDTTLPPLRYDFMQFEYTSGTSLDIDGTVALLSDESVDRYDATATSLPGEANAVLDAQADQQDPPQPRLSYSAESRLPSLFVRMRDFDTPWGNSLEATIEDLPTGAGVGWRSHGDFFTDLVVAADGDTDEPAPGGDTIGFAAIRLGPDAPPPGWPHAEPTIGLDVRQPTAETATDGRGLIVGRGLSYARLDMGDRVTPAAITNHIVATLVLGADPTDPPGGDRSLRFRYDTPDLIESVKGRARHLPDRIALDLDPSTHSYDIITGLALVRVDARFRDLLDSELLEVRGFIDGIGGGTHVTLESNDAGDIIGATLDAPRSMAVRADVRGLPIVHAADDLAELHAELLVPPSARVGLADVVEFLADRGISGRVAVAWDPGALQAATSTPQGRLALAGPADAGSDEAPPAPRAITGRVYGLEHVAFAVPEGDDDADRTDISARVEFVDGRPNDSIRFTGRELDRRYRPEIAETEWPRTEAERARLDDRQRTWARARSSLLPSTLDITLMRTAAGFAGAELTASSPWGPGVAWAEPGFALDPHPAVPGSTTAHAIGNLRANIDAIPAHLRLLMLGQSAALPEVADGDRVPTVEPPPADWTSDGVGVLVDGPLSVSNLRVAIPTGQAAACVSGSPTTRVDWLEVLGMMAGLAPADDDGGDLESFIWMMSEPAPDPAPPPADPCGDGPPGLESGFAYRLNPDVRATAATRIYMLQTESGATFSRWNDLGAQDSEGSAEVNEWNLKYAVQMSDYAGEVTIYPSHAFDIPYGDWEAGPGEWWVRAVGELEILVSSGDVYFGNTGNGAKVLFTEGVFSSLQKIFGWSYP